MELIVRFLIGGVVVSLFAAAGELFKPKTFSGLFGAAPSVALAALALAFVQHGKSYVGIETRSMMIGAVGMLLYSLACVKTSRIEGFPVWLAAGACWLVWFAAAFALFALMRSIGVLG